MMVRNEAAIIADSVGHLLNNIGIDRLYVADKDSTDQTYALLRGIAAADPRLVIRGVPGPFHQPTIMRWMFVKAVEDGADWLLPNDADEFFWPDGKPCAAYARVPVGMPGICSTYATSCS